MDRYKIKKVFHKLFKPEFLKVNWAKSDEGTYYMIGGAYDGDLALDDCIFEKVEEERIELEGHASFPNVTNHVRKKDHSVFTKKELELCEQAINGELVDKKQSYEFKTDMTPAQFKLLTKETQEQFEIKEGFEKGNKRYVTTPRPNVAPAPQRTIIPSVPKEERANRERDNETSGQDFIENEFKKAEKVIIEDGDTSYILRENGTMKWTLRMMISDVNAWMYGMETAQGIADMTPDERMESLHKFIIDKYNSI